MKTTRHHTINLCAWAGLVLLLPYSFTHELSSILYRCLVTILVANWIFARNYLQIRSLRTNNVFLLFASFYFLHVFGLIYTSNVHTGLFQLEKKAMLLVLPLIATTSPKFTRDEINLLFRMFIVSVMSACIICLAYAFYRNAQPNIEGTNWLYFTYHDFTEVISIQSSYLAIYVSFSILILLWTIAQNKDDHKRWEVVLMIAAVAVFLGFLGLLSARMPIIALFAILCIAILAFFYKKKEIVKGIFMIAGLTGLLILIIAQIPVVKERFYSGLGLTQNLEWVKHYGNGHVVEEVRLRKWYCAVDIISDHPILGVGTGDVQDELQEQYEITNFQVALNAEFNTHNQFLQTFTGLGIFGLLSLVACLIVPALISIRQKQYLYTAFIALITFCCLTESIFERQFGIVFYGLFTSLFSFNHSKTDGDSADSL